MTTATERIPVLVTKEEKKFFAQRAKDAHLSVGEFFRKAGVSFNPDENDVMLEGVINQMLKTTVQANEALDKALSFVEASNRRIEAMNSKRQAH